MGLGVQQPTSLATNKILGLLGQRLIKVRCWPSKDGASQKARNQIDFLSTENTLQGRLLALDSGIFPRHV